MARSLTVISLLLQSTTHCRYRVYTKFLLTYTAIYRGNRKVLPLGITALQPQSHFHLGTPYTYVDSAPFLGTSVERLPFSQLLTQTMQAQQQRPNRHLSAWLSGRYWSLSRL